jgi:ABC-type multidrug transport system fused ATPase/permease subunit
MTLLLVLLYLSPKLTLTMLLVIPPVFFGAFWYGRMVSKLSKEQTDALARATSVAEEKISAVRTVRYFSQEQREISHYGEKINAVSFEQMTFQSMENNVRRSINSPNALGLLAVPSLDQFGS